MLRFYYSPSLTEVQGDALELSILEQSLAFPPDNESLVTDNRFLSGLLGLVLQRLEQSGLEYQVLDRPQDEDDFIEVPDNLLADISLRDYQQLIVKKSILLKRGIIDSPCGSGKTEMSAAVVKLLGERDLRTVMIVPGVNSMHQAYRRFRRRGILDVGRLGGGVTELDQKHCIAVVNSLYSGIRKRSPEVLNLIDQVGAFLLMEAQHGQSKMWRFVATAMPCAYRLGLSATAFENSNDPVTINDYTLIGVTGNVIARLPDSLLMNNGHMATPHIHSLSINVPRFQVPDGKNFYREVYTKGVLSNAHRNACVAQLSLQLAAAGRKVLTLVKEIDHGHHLASLISVQQSDPVYFYRGGSILSTYSNGQLSEEIEVPIYELSDQLLELPAYSLIGSPAVKEDADFPDANVLINAGAGRRYQGVIQRAGRILRAKDGTDNIAHLIEMRDTFNWVLFNQYKDRMKHYEARYAGAEKLRFFSHSSVSSVVRSIVNGE